MTTLAILEVDGKQRWVFETNRLRDAVGASFLVARLADVARDAAKAAGVEPYLTASGIARAIAPTQDAAAAWIDAVTRHFAEHAPGMEVVGATAPLAGTGRDALVGAEAEAFKALAAVRVRMGGPAAIDPLLPWSLHCHYSGLPATDAQNPVKPEHQQGRRVSEGVLKRRLVFEDSRTRVEGRLEAVVDQALIRRINDAVVQAWEPLNPENDDVASEALSDRETWRGVMHIDGNGLGDLFRGFDKIAEQLGADTGAAYTQLLREFSALVERAAWRAIALAMVDLLDRAGPQRKVPVYPLLVGGDDIAVVTDGRWALFFARRFLHHWEAATGEPALMRFLDAASATNVRAQAGPLRASAGVAIVKHHFPFSIAAELARDLCDSVKEGVSGASGLDWQAVLDASPPDFRALRAQAEVPGRAPNAPGAPAEGSTFITRRPYALDEFDRLCVAARELSRRDDDGRFWLPRAQLNSLREGLRIGAAEAQRRRELDRMGAALAPTLRLLHDNDGLYDQAGRSGLLDAYDHLELMEGLRG